jgi:hypothetical protein
LINLQEHVARLEEAAAHRKRVAKIRKSQLHGSTSSSSSSSSSVDASEEHTTDDTDDDDDLFDQDIEDAYDSDSEHDDADSSSSGDSSGHSSGDSKGFDVEQYLKGILWNVQVGACQLPTHHNALSA